MSMKAIFKSTIPSLFYIFKDGTQAIFVSGVYSTDDEFKIAELKAEIKNEGLGNSKHPHIYIDPDEKEMDSEALTPYEEMQRKMRADILKELGLPRDFGNTKADVAAVANSQMVAAVTDTKEVTVEDNVNTTASATAEDMQAKLAAVKAGKK